MIALGHVYMDPASDTSVFTQKSRAVDTPKWLVECAHVLAILGRESIRDRLHVRAAMLAYWTCVALVPLLLLGFAMTGPLGLTEQTLEAVRTLLYRSILKESVEDLGGLLDQLVDSTQLKTLGLVGVLGVMFIGSQLFFSTELAYNDIFKTRVHRSWLLTRFTLFYAAITLTPIVVATGFIMTARAGIGGAGSAFELLTPWLLTTLVLISDSTVAVQEGGLVGGILRRLSLGEFV